MGLFGYERAFIALIEQPDRCHALLDHFARIVAAQVALHATCQSDAILISSAFAGAGFISRQMYRDFVLPYERRICTAIHDAQLPSYVHTCGAIGDRLDLMAESGVRGIDTLDPPPLGTVDLAGATGRASELGGTAAVSDKRQRAYGRRSRRVGPEAWRRAGSG